jgi:CUB/sushi domain-containing protein
VDCGNLYPSPNIIIPVIINTTYHSRVNFTCRDGYSLVGDSSTVCLANGLWSNEMPHCRIINCRNLFSPANGFIDKINTTYQSVANFTCKKGFNLVGSPSALCLANGSWSSDIPQCIIVDCGDLFLSPNVIIPEIISTTYHSRVKFRCRDGYNLVGDPYTLCLANGSWSNEMPHCSIVNCRDLYSPANGFAHIINTTYQSIANFTCKKGYNLVGSPSALCLANSWLMEHGATVMTYLSV